MPSPAAVTYGSLSHLSRHGCAQGLDHHRRSVGHRDGEAMCADERVRGVVRCRVGIGNTLGRSRKREQPTVGTCWCKRRGAIGIVRRRVWI